MKKLFYLTIALLIFSSSTFYSQNNFEEKSNHNTILLNDKLVQESLKGINSSQELDLLINSAMQTYHVPGLAALIIKNDSIVWSNNYGYANVSLNKPVEDSTLFMMASISKTITITALMQLWEDGLFDLEDNINDYLQPDFQIHHPNYPNDTITFKMLMTHTSSIDDNWNVLTPLTCCDVTFPFDQYSSTWTGLRDPSSNLNRLSDIAYPYLLHVSLVSIRCGMERTSMSSMNRAGLLVRLG